MARAACVVNGSGERSLSQLPTFPCVTLEHHFPSLGLFSHLWSKEVGFNILQGPFSDLWTSVSLLSVSTREMQSYQTGCFWKNLNYYILGLFSHFIISWWQKNHCMSYASIVVNGVWPFRLRWLRVWVQNPGWCVPHVEMRWPRSARISQALSFPKKWGPRNLASLIWDMKCIYDRTFQGRPFISLTF